jgi:hypothetical protein
VFGTTVAYLGPVAYDPRFVTVTGSSARVGGRSSADPYNPLLARLHTARGVARADAVQHARRRAPLAIMRLDRGSGQEPEAGTGAAAGPAFGDRAFAYWSTRGADQEAGSSG